ncbi:hypothetical protein BCR34DRAFT_589703 [Clohesyomyces aquaticus]|uniref:Uncharacterized protein n=1 Tax=Clohesyomyces aquaticus TaxID=1231657 RepID=A0A1Y1ZF05_9PLEO|nr:hypothetical protein BCR34DRAFT_589703 [Clohesyomyces aquaticus]
MRVVVGSMLVAANRLPYVLSLNGDEGHSLTGRHHPGSSSFAALNPSPAFDSIPRYRIVDSPLLSNQNSTIVICYVWKHFPAMRFSAIFTNALCIAGAILAQTPTECAAQLALCRLCWLLCKRREPSVRFTSAKLYNLIPTSVPSGRLSHHRFGDDVAT